MKTLIGLIIFAFASLPILAQSAGQKAKAYYQKGVAAEKAGKPDEALASYKAALKLYPEHARARYRAGQVKINASSIKADATEAKIGAVVIPVYQIEDATVSEAIELLTIGMDKATKGKIAPNFIIEDPKGKLADTRISMQLKNIPVKAVLEYIHNQANTKARYDEHAVVILAR
ncbi:MAG: tetratricopeptide repeat protein [Verrucomicrobia bacterium]|jgi:tetratricopeptide (TPR) repeat protein|nr:tetratricopeptide repeat protein [Verrucomicrobiota bacterium]|tara:strand:+ start:21355 stop:21876 length:522 start_codon:yes stop_codon:yes gene_type:complete